MNPNLSKAVDGQPIVTFLLPDANSCTRQFTQNGWAVARTYNW